MRVGLLIGGEVEVFRKTDAIDGVVVKIVIL